MKKITVHTDVVEMMIFYWTGVSEREKIAEPYIISVAERPEMRMIYDDTFDGEAVRRVLSAISNREMLNGGSAKERRFWNNNMWMMEDLGVMEAMVAPMKTLNLQEDAKDITTKSGLEEVEVVFVPGTNEPAKVVGNKLLLNFFNIHVDVFGGTGEVTFDGKPFRECVIDRIREM